MTLEFAIRLTEILTGFAFIQQSMEHIFAPKNEQILFIPRIILCVFLILGFETEWVSLALMALALLMLYRFQGPYNGGSDRMSLLLLSCLCLVHFLPEQSWRELVFGYLALQLVMSYFISGWVKIINPEWRNGLALNDVFRYSSYPVSEHLRGLWNWPKLLLVMSWAVILFELIFPLTLISQPTLILGLVIAATFHLANAFLFGLNRFFWIWLAAYPSIIWLQFRIFDAF